MLDGVYELNKKFILGIDGGGTYTRVAITDTDGNLASYVQWHGGAFLLKDAKANENVLSAICEAIKKADCELSDIGGITAGIAGYDTENDLKWVRELTNIQGLACTPQHVNDAVIAHKGALLSNPGIIAISGTGSVIFGITEPGRHVRNYDFHHYSFSKACYLSYNSVYAIIAGETDQTDIDFMTVVFKHFAVKDLAALVQLGSEGFIEEYSQRDQLFGSLAPAVTQAALNGSHLAERVCMRTAEDIVTGVEMVGACFESESVMVALIGSVANSTVIKSAINELLSRKCNKKYVLAEHPLPPVLGAIMMTLEQIKIIIDKQVIENLFRSAEAIALSPDR